MSKLRNIIFYICIGFIVCNCFLIAVAVEFKKSGILPNDDLAYVFGGSALLFTIGAVSSYSLIKRRREK